ncbi:MAG: hypothetical protein Q7R76_04875 [Candidatus Woesearchaeota archaeon]|nr:hypothetical protein [Candidatus Woesearchaeota archaeon]
MDQFWEEDEAIRRRTYNALETMANKTYGLGVDYTAVKEFLHLNDYSIADGTIFKLEKDAPVARSVEDVTRELAKQHIPAAYLETYEGGVAAFRFGDLAIARSMLESFRKTVDCPHGTYLLGVVVGRLYPEDVGAQKFSRHLIGKARTLDAEIETKMKPITTQGE